MLYGALTIRALRLPAIPGGREFRMRGKWAILAIAAIPLLGLVGAAPAAASAAHSGPVPWLPGPPTSNTHSIRTVPDRSPSALAGFAAVTFSGTLASPGTTYDSAGGAVVASPTGTGTYEVLFNGISVPGGDVQVTAVTGTCTVEGWSGSPAAEAVFIDCFNLAGVPANESFDVLVTQPHTAPNGFLAYDWNYILSGSGRLVGVYQYNSLHHTNSVRHLSTGHYLITMPGPGLRGASRGTVKVSSYGISGGNCLLASAITTRAGEKIYVDCFDVSGAPQDRRFTVVYARGNNLMGQNGKVDANATANGAAPLYQPRMQFDSKPHARITVVHLDRGLYEVFFIGSNTTRHLGGLGNLEVTPLGSAPRYCFAGLFPTHNPGAAVQCVTPAGAPANTAFTIQLVIN